jgi:acyl carrier protein
MQPKREEIESWVRAHFAGVLEIGESQITSDAKFDSLGVDSATATGLILDIERQYHVRLPETLIFDFPTLRKLTDRLAEVLKTQPRRN